MSRPKVSVVIPCYNHAAFIAEAIESVLNQTYRDFELIVADNGSTDNSREIIERYADQIEIVRLEKNNPELCYNILLSDRKGEYIAILSSDDYWYPEKLEEQMKAVEEQKRCDIFFTWSLNMDCNLERMVGGDKFIKSNATRAEWVRRLLLEGTVLEGSSLLYKNENRILKYIQDSMIFRQLPDCRQYIDMVLQEEIYVVEKVLVKHRMHGNNVSAPNPLNMIASINEKSFLYYEIWNKITDEMFEQAFFESDAEGISHVEVTCHKILLYLKIAEQTEGMGSLALAYVWQHYQDEGVKELLAEKYGFTRETIFAYERKIGEGKEWYENYHRDEVKQKEEVNNTEESENPLKKILKSFISCNEKVLAHYENGQLREELIDVIKTVLDGLRNINLVDETVGECEEKLAKLMRDKLDKKMWIELVNSIGALNEKLKLYLRQI